MYSVQDKGPQGWLGPVGITINQKKKNPYFSNSLFDLASINSSYWSWAPPWRKTPTGRQHAVSTQSLLQQRFLCIPSHSLLVFQLWKISTICTPAHERKMPLKNMTLLTERWRCVLLGLAMVHSVRIFETRDCESNIAEIILPKCSEKELPMPQSKKDFQTLILISWFLKRNCSSAANHVCAFGCLQKQHFPRCF